MMLRIRPGQRRFAPATTSLIKHIHTCNPTTTIAATKTPSAFTLVPVPTATHAKAPFSLGPRAQHPASTHSNAARSRSPTTARTFSSMSDADYEAFLNKANSGSGGDVQAQSNQSYGTKSVNTGVPKSLEAVQEYYTSDADEPFEPVALNYDAGGDGLDAQQLGTLLSHSGSVTELSVRDWDPKGQYKSIVDAVKEAIGSSSDGGVKVFKVELEGTRAEYYIVGVVEGKVVGLKALSVES